MHWEVQFGTEKTQYSAPTLVQSLIGKMVQSDFKYDQMSLATELVNTMPAEALRTATAGDLMTLGFRIGYLYRLFLERNDVVCPEAPALEDTTTTDTNSGS